MSLSFLPSTILTTILTVLGIGSDAPTVDWVSTSPALFAITLNADRVSTQWAVGVVLYEFIYGFPPFHDETPEKVFDNIVSRRINWFEDQMELSSEARDLMERLMCTDPGRRLGAHGACEVKSHPFFTGLDWHTIATVEANFVPNVTDPESTDYFDARGATSEVFFEDDTQSSEKAASKEISSEPTGKQASGLDQPIDIVNLAPPGDAGEDFGTFTYKNLPVLKQANDEVIKKLRRESMIASEQLGPHDRRLSVALERKRTKNRAASVAEVGLGLIIELKRNLLIRACPPCSTAFLHLRRLRPAHLHPEQAPCHRRRHLLGRQLKSVASPTSTL